MNDSNDNNISIDVQDILAHYQNEIASLTHRLVIAEAQVDAMRRAQQPDPEREQE